MRATRVGFFTEVYHPILNGVVASIDALAGTLAARGCDVTFVTPFMPGQRDDIARVVRLPSFPLPTPTSYRLTIPFMDRVARRRARELSIVHAHSPFVTGALAASVARRARVPLVFTYHTQLEAYAHYVPFDARAVRFAARSLTRCFANVADVVIVPTTTMHQRLRDLGVTVPIAVVPSGIDVAYFARGARRDDARARLGIARDARVIASVGRLGREKNIEAIVEAFARVRDPLARLLVVGDGPHRPSIERAARIAGVASRTHFAGEFSRERLPDAYAAADVFAFASRSETQGLVLVEALASGLPVVALDTPQTRDVVGDAGELVADDPNAFAHRLEAVLAEAGTPAAQRRRERGAAVARAFDAATLGGRVLDLYASLLGPREAAYRTESAAAFAGVN